jgi:hypothetical protein
VSAAAIFLLVGIFDCGDEALCVNQTAAAPFSFLFQADGPDLSGFVKLVNLSP